MNATVQNILKLFQKNRLAQLGLILLVCLFVMALFAPWLAWQNPYDLAQLDISDANLPPGSLATDKQHTYWLGSDEQGRDMISAMLYGLRTSILVGITATLCALLIGTMIGLVSGYFSGRIDATLMRIVDLQLSFPAILIALVLLVVFGQGISKIIFALIAAQWAFYARTARSSALVESQKDYIKAARLLALPTWRIIIKHLLPNCISPLMVVAALQIAAAIALEATLSFLGAGLPVTEPSLGLLIANGFRFLQSGKYWVSIFPGVLLLITILSINLVADHLREALNPRLKNREGNLA